MFCIKRGSVMVRTDASYSGGPGLQYQASNHLPWLRSFVGFHTISKHADKHTDAASNTEKVKLFPVLN
jgi:hypothetical protein